jgi:hypothetical protein
MSHANDAFDTLPAWDPSADFGREEGLMGYDALAHDFPDQTIERIAAQAVNLEKLACQRIDVDEGIAVAALIGKIIRISGFPIELSDLTEE